jgi:hypothetical protein
MNALEESERLIFRSAIAISETDMAIQRSLRLIGNKPREKSHMRLLLKCALSVNPSLCRPSQPYIRGVTKWTPCNPLRRSIMPEF